MSATSALSAEMIRRGVGPGAIGPIALAEAGAAESRLRDREIREALYVALASTTRRASDSSWNHIKDLGTSQEYALLIDEFRLDGGYVRADLVVMQQKFLHVYEIKSDLDHLNRLPEQMRLYNGIADHVTLVVGWEHAVSAMRMVPSWWEIWLAERNENQTVSFIPLRELGSNPNVSSSEIAGLLDRGHALKFLADHHASVGVRSKPLHVLCAKIASLVSAGDDKLLERLRGFVHQYWLHRRPRSVRPLTSNDD